MLEKFRHYLEQRISFTEEEWESIKTVCIAKKLRRGEYLLKEGEIWRYAAIVCQGCIRTFRADEQQKIRILNFTTEYEWAGDSQSLQNVTPSIFNIDAVEPTEIVLLHKEDFELLCRQLPQLHQLITENLKECLSMSQRRIDLATSPTAEERYRYFSTYHTPLLLRLPQYMIASYLGITPESLSRVRKKLAKEQLASKVFPVTV